MLDRARIYACGITPYDVTHLGHAATFVWIDTLCRTLRLLGIEPEICRNITDVDDVLDAAAQRAGAPFDAFAAVQQFHFERDMAALGVRAVQHEPRAHRYVGQVIRLAAGLLATGAAYQPGQRLLPRRNGRPGRGPGPGRRAVRLSAEYGGRPDDPGKDDPLDAAVWQASEPGHPAWESPWGPGRPGWHAECAAMALSVFGVGVDIHAGGKRPSLPAPRLPRGDGRGIHRRPAVRPRLAARRHRHLDGGRWPSRPGNLVLLDNLLAATIPRPPSG